MKLFCIAVASTIHTQRWVRYFANRGHEVHLISPVPLGEGNIGTTELHILTGFPLHMKIVSPIINVMPHAIQVRSLIKKINPDILNAHYITDNGLLGVISGFHPLVLNAWGSDVLIDPKRYPFVKTLTKYALSKADLIICDSETLKEGLLELGASESNVRIVYNGVDTQVFEPRKRDEGLKKELGISGSPTIISIRNLDPVYNVEMFIQAIPLILKEVPDARFIIGGHGRQKGYLQDLANLLGVSSTIRFTGWIPHNELPKYLASSDIYVSTSVSDSTAVSLQEAMACELAPVVTDLKANREWVTHEENGFLVRIGKYEGLANRIVYLLKYRETTNKFGKVGRKVIMERAEYWREMDKMEKICAELLGK